MTNGDFEPRRRYRNGTERAECCMSCGELATVIAATGCCQDCLERSRQLEDWDELGDVD